MTTAVMPTLVVLAVIGMTMLVLLIVVTLFHCLVCLADVWLSWLGKKWRWLR